MARVLHRLLVAPQQKTTKENKMIFMCEFIKKGDKTLNVVSTVNIFVDDCDAETVICDPSVLNGVELVCITAEPITTQKAKNQRKP